MNNEKLPQNPEQPENPEQPGQTRVMPPVEATGRPARRRRSERYSDATREESSNLANLVEANEAEISAAREVGATVPASDSRVAVSREAPVRQPVPRPNVLNRAAEAQARTGEPGQTAAVRRPMGTPPGFTPRQPLNLDAQDSAKGTPVALHGSGTGPRLPSSVSGTGRQGAGQSGKYSRKKPKSHKALIAVIIALLLLGLAIVGFMLLSQNDEGPLGQLRQSLSGLMAGGTEQEPVTDATASGFTAAMNYGTAPLDVVFNLTTSKSVTQVRLVDEDGMPLGASGVPVTENADSIIWMMNLTVTDGYEGFVLAQIYDGANWLDTGMSQSLEIAMPAPSATIDLAAFNESTDEPERTDEATEEPAEALTEAAEPSTVPTEEPTQAPTAEPTDGPSPTPTLAVTETPAVALAVSDSPIPPALAATQAPIDAAEIDMPEEQPTEEEAEEATDAPVEEQTEEPAALPTATPPLTGVAAESADPSLIRDTVIYNGSSKVDSYTRERAMNMPVADAYITQPYGVMTYRGNAFRQNAAVGTVGDISEMTLAWTAEAGSAKGASSTYYGIGWTGQPAIIKWSKEVREATNIKDEKKGTTALKEVIVAGLDGKIYFLDLADGQPTRDAINLGYPMRGTPSLHPLGYPIMAVGQYGRKMASGTGDIGLRVYNLLTQKQSYWIDGLDGKANRPYYSVGAFDTSALIDPNTDTMVAVGTNGMLYTVYLDTEYSVGEQKVSINPAAVSMKSRTKGQSDRYTAVQSSPAMYGSYVYYADMEGILRCVDTTTMTTVWAVDTGDAVEAAIALDMDGDGNLWLYTANTLENRKKGDCSIRRYNALTGEESWSFGVNVATAKNGKTPGAMASPVIGQYELEDMVYFTLSNVSAAGGEALFGESGAAAGVLLAMDKATGGIVWAHQLDAYSYSSPVAVYAADGQGWIVQASSSGLITLLDGMTGSVISTLEVEGTIDASPAVYNDTLVVGTTGKNTTFIYGITLR